MQLLGQKLLTDFQMKHPNARKPLDAWRSEVTHSNWSASQDIKERYVSASFLENNKVIFNIKGNDYRLVVKVQYKKSMVQIEWIGTHEEYNKKKF